MGEYNTNQEVLEIQNEEVKPQAEAQNGKNSWELWLIDY